IVETAERVLGAFGDDIAARPDVVWMDRPAVDERQRPPTLRVAPLDVGGLLAERVFRPRTVVLTSATLAVGGAVEPVARPGGAPGSGGCRARARTAPDLPGTNPRRKQPMERGKKPAGRMPPREGTGWPGPGATSARRSITRAAPSSTSRATCPRPAGTGCPRRTSPNCGS